jgi:hypothetical protein
MTQRDDMAFALLTALCTGRLMPKVGEVESLVTASYNIADAFLAKADRRSQEPMQPSNSYGRT